MQAVTPITPLQAGGDAWHGMKTTVHLEGGSLPAISTRPVSHVSEITEILDTDFEDDSDPEPASPKGSFDSYDSRRRSQTTISSFDEAQTPSPRTSIQSRPPLDLRVQPVQGPRGPHLFRASTVSAEFDFEHALQMSPLLPKHMTLQPYTPTADSESTVTPVVHKKSQPPSYPAAADSEGPEVYIRSWSTDQVIEWMDAAGMDPTVIECFAVNDIDGFVLVDLQFEDLKELGIQSFGKRHQLWNAICHLKGDEGPPSPQPTPFQDISRPCTSTSRRSPNRDPVEKNTSEEGVFSPVRAKSKRRGRKMSKTRDVITPAESISIVAIEQLMPKPHQCAKGERCAKWRKQQRDLEQLKGEHGIGRFPISPTKGGHIFVAGDPGNPSTAGNMISHVKAQSQPRVQGQLRLENPFRPVSEQPLESAGFPSVVASSDLLGPGQLPEFALHEDALHHLGSRDPQDNVKQFLKFQHVNSPMDPTPLSPAFEMFPSQSVSPFPAAIPQFHEAPAVMQPTRQSSLGAQTLQSQLRGLPKLDIPRSQSAGPQLNKSAAASPLNTRSGPAPGTTICHSATASPASIWRHGTPASEMDIPTTAIPTGPVSRDTSQSVPPNMQFRPQNQLSRSHSRAEPHWRRPSLALPAVQENEIFSPTLPDKHSTITPRPSISTSQSTSSIPTRSTSVRDPAHHSPITQNFGYGAENTHSGWMRKRKTKILRHEWNESHFRLKGTQLTQHSSSRLSAEVKETINVDNYAVACSSYSQDRKLTAALKSFSLSRTPEKKSSSSSNSTSSFAAASGTDVTAFAFQLIPSPPEKKSSGSSSSSLGGSSNGGSWGRSEGKAKAHHFAVKTKDERIDWMRELMLAKAREQKEKGFEVEVNGVVQG